MNKATLTPKIIFGLIARLIAIVLCAEILVMLLFSAIGVADHLSEWVMAIADDMLLILLSAWPVALWVLNPLLMLSNKASLKTEMLAAALEHAGDSVIITDRSGIMLYVNHAFEQTTGYSRDEAVGENPNILQSGRHDGQFYTAMWDALTSSGEWQGEMWNKRKSGELYPQLLHIRAFHDQKGILQYYIGTFSDISERIALERVARKSQKIEALGRLVGGVAQNFNNMLSGIIGKVYLARKKTDSPDAIRHMDDIHELGQNGARLIKHLLDFAHQSQQEKQRLSLNLLFKNAVRAASIDMPADIQLITDFPTSELSMHGDPVQLEQIATHLLTNARDAVALAAEKTIRVSLEKQSSKQCPLREHCSCCSNYVAMLTVEDSGCGIPPADLEHIFDPFFTRKKQDEGAGLGLSICSGTVEAHGGMIHVESEQGKGARFIVCLPLANSGEK